MGDHVVTRDALMWLFMRCLFLRLYGGIHGWGTTLGQRT